VRERVDLRALAIALPLVALLAWPWRPLQIGSSRAYAALANAFVGPLVYAGRGHARVLPLPHGPVRFGTDETTADAQVELTVDGLRGALALGANGRRAVFFPLLLVVCVACGARLPWRRRALAGAIAAIAVIALAVATLALEIAAAFASDLRGVGTPPGPVASAAWQIVRRLWLLPPANPFVAALLASLAATVAARRSLADEDRCGAPGP
jgi:hypothetical protein